MVAETIKEEDEKEDRPMQISPQKSEPEAVETSTPPA
jgi:hypothetical protein